MLNSKTREVFKEYKVTIMKNDAGDLTGYRINVKTALSKKTFNVNKIFIDSIEYQDLVNHHEGLQKYLNANFKVTNVDDEEKIDNFANVAEISTFILDSSKTGAYIQRYKGLGEMNPEQLWETTMNPGNRTLLQVKIEDNFIADQVFSVLMGDQVEPRRDFVEKNALSARNLDV